MMRIMSYTHEIASQFFCDNREQFALDFGRSYLHHGDERNLDVLFRKIDAVTAEGIQKVAEELFPADNLNTLIIK